MALSMEEQRILAEIEQELARAEPALAERLATFGSATRASLLRSSRTWLRSPRVLVLASLAALVLLTVVPVLVYAFVSLRGTPGGQAARRQVTAAEHHAAPPHPVMSAPK
jgi:Protein of unknown function (DUF3040)